MFNLNLAIDVLAQIEESEELKNQSDSEPGAWWEQGMWGQIQHPDRLGININRMKFGDVANLDLIYDPVTNEPVGLGTCGTGMCAAGWGLTLSNVRMRFEKAIDGTLAADKTVDGRAVAVAGAEVFGIAQPGGDEFVEDLWDDGESMPALFKASNELSDLYEIMAEYAGIDEDDLRARVDQARAALWQKATEKGGALAQA